SSSMPLSMEFSPRKLFGKLFVQSDTTEGRALRVRRSSSILDLVAADAADLRRVLGPADRAKLGAYLETVRDVESRVENAEARLCSSKSPDAVADSFAERMNLMFDMIALAFQADITRVATFMMAAEASEMTYDHLGVTEPFHQLSHHQNDPAKIEKLVRIQNY